MVTKQRLSASVDASLLAAAQVAADHDAGTTLSAWVNEAIRLKLEHDRRLRALAAFVSAAEAEGGEITDAEIQRTNRAMSARAIHVRGRSSRLPTRRRAAR